MFNTTIIGTPSYLSPMNVEFNTTFTLNNLGSSADNFKYITKLNSFLYATGPTQSLGRESLPPRPVNGYGKYSPFKSLLSKLSYDLQLVNSGGIFWETITDNSLVNYWIDYGFSYNPNLDLEPPIYDVIVGTNSYFGFTFSTPHGFEVGDVINISTQNPYFGGTSSILSYNFGTYSITIDKGFTSSSNVSTGNINYLERWNGTSSIYNGFNGSRQYNEINYDYGSNYIINGLDVDKKFLTKYNNGTFSTAKKIKINQYETLSYFIDGDNWYGGSIIIEYNFYDVDLNNVQLSSVGVGPVPGLSRGILYVGPENLTIAGVPAPPPYVYYTVQLREYLGSFSTEIKHYEIDNDCSIYENVRLMFLNSLGGFDFWNFTQDNKMTYNVTRNEYKQELDFSYNIGDRERTIMSQKAEEAHIINTNFINESDYHFLGTELILSPEVYVVDETNGDLYPIIITDNTYEFKTSNRDKIFNLTLSYVMSYDIKTQDN
jgi:hypothetical protein